MTHKFWEKTLQELTHEEWESLCDGCGLCCLHRFQDEDDDNAPILTTRVVCRCYDLKNGGCSDYDNRFTIVPECTRLTLSRTAQFDWLPQSCAYRLRYHNMPLPQWHPLISGTSESVKEYGVFALNPVLETDEIDFEDYILEE